MWHNVAFSLYRPVFTYTHQERGSYYDNIYTGLYGNLPHSATCHIDCDVGLNTQKMEK